MCGRFERCSSIEHIAQEFRVQKVSFEIPPSYNIAPTQNIVIINNQGTKQLVSCRWGFLPSWAKDPSIGHKMINARAETVSTKPTFKSAFKKQRCLVIADGFFEWKNEKNRKVPYLIRLKSGKPFGFAGLYNQWTSESGEKICTCTIITTEANELLEPIHDRMPVIIPRDKEDYWLNPSKDLEALMEMLKPYTSEEMEMYEVSSKINYPKYNSPDVLEPILK